MEKRGLYPDKIEQSIKSQKVISLVAENGKKSKKKSHPEIRMGLNKIGDDLLSH
jgi:hypothetical protein